jgi:hypothetical protein
LGTRALISSDAQAALAALVREARVEEGNEWYERIERLVKIIRHALQEKVAGRDVPDLFEQMQAINLECKKRLTQLKAEGERLAKEQNEQRRTKRTS